MTSLLITRHGQTDWNLERRWQGHADPPLNETGRAQARALAASLEGTGLEAIVSSDLLRARETAEIVARLLDVPVRLDARLREVDVGEWSGLTSAEVERLYPDGHRRRLAGETGWNEGESYESLASRVAEALLDVAAERSGGRVLVVTHGGAIRTIWLAAGNSLGDWCGTGNCDVVEVAIERGLMRWIDSSRGGLHEQVQR